MEENKKDCGCPKGKACFCVGEARKEKQLIERMPQENKTPQEIAKGFASTCPMTPLNVEIQLTALLKQYRKDQFNRAIELAAEKAGEHQMTMPAGSGRSVMTNGVIDPESILKLKIK